MNAEQYGTWMQEAVDRFGPDLWFYERDASTWDAMMQRFHHNLKMRVYRAANPQLADFVEGGFKCKATGWIKDSVLKYTIVGTVKSGHNDTTLGNSLINAMIALEVCARSGLSAEILVAGDDLLVACDADPSGLAALEREYGIIPKFGVFRDYLDVSFVSACWLRTSTTFLFVPKLGRLLARLWWTVKPPSIRKIRDYRYSVVTGLRTAVGSVPLYDEFLRCEGGVAIELGRDFRFWVDNFRGNAPCDQVTVDDLMRKYHLLPSEYEGLRHFLADLPLHSCLFSHPLVEKVCLVDLADPEDRQLAVV